MIVTIPENLADFKLNDLRCFDAVARLGSFQAAGRALNRSHPAIFAAVAALEARLDIVLLDRTGYRTSLTEAGLAFHRRARETLRELDALAAYGRQLSRGEEPSLRVVLGDLCPRPLVLRLLSDFFAPRERTRLHLDYEAVGGPAERLRDATADLVFHRVEDTDPGVEVLKIADIRLVPVAAPGFLPFTADDDPTPEQLRPFTQCVIRDTARDAPAQDHFLIEGAHRCSVPDHGMKKELILHGMGWGHLPDFMVAEEIRDGTLISIRGRHWPGRVEQLAAIRRRDRPHGPVARELWAHLGAAVQA